MRAEGLPLRRVRQNGVAMKYGKLPVVMTGLMLGASLASPLAVTPALAEEPPVTAGVGETAAEEPPATTSAEEVTAEAQNAETDKSSAGAEGSAEAYAFNKYSGTCGENATWRLDNGTLTISGTGAIKGDSLNWHAGSIDKVVIEEGITDIGDNCFARLYVKEVSLPTTLKTIGKKAFTDCRFESLEIPETVRVTSIGSEAFSNNPSLKKVVWPGSIPAVPESAFADCGKLSEVTLSKGVTKVARSAFARCGSLKAVSMPDTLVTIEGYVFQQTALSEFKAPKGLKSIGDNAFEACQVLTTFTLNEGLESIGGSIFGYRAPALTSLTIPSTVKSIGDGAFRYLNELKSATILGASDKIGYRIFAGCGNLESLSIGEGSGKVAVGEDSFSDLTSLKTVKLGKGVTSIGAKAFYGDSRLASVEIPASCKSIGDNAFYRCYSLESVKFADGLATIGTSAFEGCSIKGTVSLPASIRSLGDASLKGVSRVDFAGNAPSGASSFNDRGTKATYPAGNKTWTNEAKGRWDAIQWYSRAQDGKLTRDAYYSPYPTTNLAAGKVDLHTFKLDKPDVLSTDAFKISLAKDSTISISVTPYWSKDCWHQRLDIFLKDSANQNRLDVFSTMLSKEKYPNGATYKVKLPAGDYYLEMGYLDSHKNHDGYASVKYDVVSQAGSIVFSDVKKGDEVNHASDVQWLADQGISTGWKMANGTYEFRGGQSVARADMAAFLYRMAGSPDYTPSAAIRRKFKDVNGATDHATAIWWLAEKGISTGWSDGTFRPMATVARQDMAAFLHRFAKTVWKSNPAGSSKLAFSDVRSGDETNHASDVQWLAANGVSTGWKVGSKYEFRGLQSVARQDMAAFLHRLSDNVQGTYGEGEYRVGTDIPAGEYKVLANNKSYGGYYCVYPNQNKGDIVANDNFDTQTYVTVSSGQLLTVERAQFVAVSKATASNGVSGDGLYKVGYDIPAGSYEATRTGSGDGYYAIYDSSIAGSKKILENGLFGNNAHFTVEEGQYLQISRASVRKE